MKPVYDWSDARARYGFDDPTVPAQAVGEHLDRLRERYPDGFTRLDVLQSAREPESPIHSLFTWDDRSAANRWRLEQAKNLTRAIMVVKTEDDDQPPVRVRAFVTVEDDDSDEEDSPQRRAGQPRQARYIGVDEALADPVKRRILLDKALVEIRGWRKRYEQLTELASIFEAVESVQQAMTDEHAHA